MTLISDTKLLFIITFALNIACESHCIFDDPQCLKNDQCFGSANYANVTLINGAYTITKAFILTNQCETSFDVSSVIGGAAMVSEDRGTVSITLPNGTDLGSGMRDTGPYCNSVKIIQSVPQYITDECDWETKYVSGVSIYDYGSLGLQITSDRIRRGGTCPSSLMKCSVVYSIVMKLGG